MTEFLEKLYAKKIFWKCFFLFEIILRFFSLRATYNAQAAKCRAHLAKLIL